MANEELILSELRHLREDMGEIKQGLKDHIENQCKTCQTTPKFSERFRSQWTHIQALWAAIVILAGYFYNHVTGK